MTKRCKLIAAVNVITAISLLLDFKYYTVDDTYSSFKKNNQNEQNSNYSVVYDQLNDSVALIITSCGRWKLLEITIDSFEKYNTYNYIETKIVMDDCDDIIGLTNFSKQYPNYHFIHTKTPRNEYYTSTEYRILLSIKEGIFDYVINNPFYEHIEYIFTIEDDWKFYKYGFIEDSFAIIKSDYNQKYLHKPLSMIHLRNIQYYKPYLYIYEFCGGFKLEYIEGFGNLNNFYTSNIAGYRNKKVRYYIHGDDTFTKKPCWGHYSNNPGLKKVSHFKLFWENITVNGRKESCKDEYCLSCLYKKNNFSTAITSYNGYLGHTGLWKHVSNRQLLNDQDGFTVIIKDKIAIDNRNCMYVRLNNSNNSSNLLVSG